MGEGETIDGDDPAHIKWIHDKALARAEEYGIQGVNYRLTQGKIESFAAMSAISCVQSIEILFSLVQIAFVKLHPDVMVFLHLLVLMVKTSSFPFQFKALSSASSPRWRRRTR